ncbi:transmembrane protein 43 [Rhodopirellula maiorica SM1]|uniref:Transmembrane protein 43 n=1 Tax=Rhodopirellula maiorica SM1 TaxID=1265738 RepID=M5RST2_9BACT|nr:TMEM43 family protein [Rhodopirellula maiorica]EMI17029.1 transmembrane protein 43 [Rhodopirellula maiorica SM1]
MTPSAFNHSSLINGGRLIVFLAAGLLLLGMILSLHKSEKSLVQTAGGLDEAALATIEIDGAKPQPEHNGKLVYITGRLETSEPIRDETFALEVDAVRLERHVEMFQWREYERRRDSLSTNDRSIGRRKKVYRYEKIWSKQLIDSSAFRHSGYDNPTAMPFPSDSVQADKVQLGGFRLSDSLIDQIPPSDPLNFRLSDLSASIARDSFIHHDAPNQAPRLYWSAGRGRTRRDAQIGDARVYFTTRPSGTVSVMSQQNGDSFVPYRTATGAQIDLLSMGVVKPDVMVHHARHTAIRSAWAGRLIATVVMMVALYLLMRIGSRVINPFAYLTRITELQRWRIAAAVAVTLACFCVCSAWSLHHPWYAVSVLAIAVPIIPVSVRGIRPRSMPLRSDASVSDAEHRKNRKRKRRRRLAKRRRKKGGVG